MTDAHRDLSSLTRKPGRAAGLAGKLGTRPAAVPDPAPAPTADPAPETPPDGPAPTDTARAPRRPSRRTQPPEPAPTPQGDGWRKQSWPAYVPGPVLERIRTTTEGRSLGEWLLDGYEVVHERLDDRFPRASTSTSGLPPRTPRPRRSVDTAQEVHFRLTGDEIAILEQRITELGCSRSAFATAVAELYLGVLDRP